MATTTIVAASNPVRVEIVSQVEATQEIMVQPGETETLTTGRWSSVVITELPPEPDEEA